MADDYIILSNFATQGMNRANYEEQGPMKTVMAFFEEMEKSPLSLQAVICKSIRDGDMETLGRSLKDKVHHGDDFNTKTKGGLIILLLASLYDRPEAVNVFFKHEKASDLDGSSHVAPILAACRLGRLAVLDTLLQNGVDPLQSPMFGVNMLLMIARFFTVDLVELIFDSHGITPPVNDPDADNATPLHHAAQRGDADFCSWLLSHGANARARDDRQMTPVMYACGSGHANVISLLIPPGSSAIKEYLNDVDDEGMTALHHGVAEGEIQVTQLLLSLGMDANAKTNDGSMPLHLCAAFDHGDVIPSLVQSGAFLESRDLSHKTPLHRASENGSINATIRLIYEGADINSLSDGGISPLFLACSKGHADIVDLLLTCRADCTLVDHMGKSCLHTAIEYGHFGVVKLLLEKCPRPFVSIQNVMKMNALHIAATKDIQFVEALIAYDELIHVKDILGRYPLHLAARYGSGDNVLALAKLTKDISTQTIYKKTPLFLACEAGNTESVLTLEKMGADINDRDLFNLNALMVAASNGSMSIVTELIRVGADVNSSDKRKNTALHLACLNGHLSTVKVLVENGASVKGANLDGRNPLLVAVEGFHTKVAMFLISHESWEDSLSMHECWRSKLMDKMIHCTPEAVQIQFCYKYIDPEPNACATHSHNTLETLSRLKREDLLAHPVCQSFLMLKWQRFGRFALILHIIINLASVSCVFPFISVMPKLGYQLDENGCNIQASSNNSTSANATSPETFEKNDSQETLLYQLQIALLVCITLQFMKELRFLCSEGQRYFCSISNIMLLVALSLMAYILLPPGREFCIHHWRLTFLAVFLFSIHSSMTFLRIDSIGLYFSMFFEVTRGILKITCLLLFYIVTLSMPLSIIFRRQDGFNVGYATPFTTLAMTLGELNYRDNIIRGNNYPFTVDSYVVFLIFALIMPIVVVNLMIGVAIGDINKITKEAYLLRMRNQISFLLSVEKSMPKSFRQRFYTRTYTMRPNTNKRTLKGQIQRWLMNDDRIEFICKNPEAEENDKLKEEIKKQNAMIEKLREMTACIQNDLARLKKNDSKADASSEESKKKATNYLKVNQIKVKGNQRGKVSV